MWVGRGGWEAPLFGSPRRCLACPVVWIADHRSVIWIARSFRPLRRLDRSVTNRRWIAFGLPRRLDRPVVWIALSFGLPVALRRLDRTLVWIAPSFGSRRRLDRSVVVWIAPVFG